MLLYQISMMQRKYIYQNPLSVVPIFLCDQEVTCLFFRIVQQERLLYTKISQVLDSLKGLTGLKEIEIVKKLPDASQISEATELIGRV